MEAPFSIKPFTPAAEALLSAWNKAGLDQKEDDQLEVINFLKDNITYFNQHDLPVIEALLGKIRHRENINPELLNRVENLAGVLRETPKSFSFFEGLAQELSLHVLRFDKENRLYRSNKALNEIGALETLVYNPKNPYRRVSILLEMLDKCGQIHDLDLTRVLWRGDQKSLVADELKAILAKCPQLRTLTICGTEGLKPGELTRTIVEAPARKSLCEIHIICCIGMNDEKEFIPLIEACPNLVRFQFAPQFGYQDIVHLIEEEGMHLRDYLQLSSDKQMKIAGRLSSWLYRYPVCSWRQYLQTRPTEENRPARVVFMSPEESFFLGRLRRNWD